MGAVHGMFQLVPMLDQGMRGKVDSAQSEISLAPTWSRRSRTTRSCIQDPTRRPSVSPALSMSDKITRNGSGVRHQVSACQTPDCLSSIMAFVRTSPNRGKLSLVEITASWMFIRQQPGCRGGRSPSTYSREPLLGCQASSPPHAP